MSGFFIIRQSEEASSTKDASTWIAEVSHELRLPIANIRLLVETLLDGALEDPDVCRRMLKRAYKETERLQALVSDLLSLEQVSQNRQDNKCVFNNLLDRAQYAVDSVMTRALAKGVKLNVTVPPSFQVYANPEQLDQVLLNLVENAVKFTAEGGTVNISCGEQTGCFIVSDTGVGMAQSEIPKIFQRFYRIDRTQAPGSTGLGLSIVKNIVELHGAKITVDSQEGVGSSFTLEFPGPKQAPPASGA
jgi:two-component system phosphate regulon sensor histidine kinase PhoR